MEDGVRKILPVLGVVPLVTGAAMAVQPLNDNQMDGVTAGFVSYNPPPSNLAVSAAGPNLAAIVASVTPGPPPPLVSRDNFPPSMFTQPTGRSTLPASPFFWFTVNPGGPAFAFYRELQGDAE
jgi:hypothetical protein